MSSFCYSGIMPLKVDESKYSSCEHGARGMYEYPFREPKVFLDGCGESYSPQYCFDWLDDSVVFIRGERMIEYTLSHFQELLAKDGAGNIIWVDGRTAPYSGCWDGEYLDDIRGAHEYTITEYNMDTLEKQKYKVTLDSVSKLGARDLHKMAYFMEEAKAVSHFEVDDGVLKCYVGNEKELVIPNDASIKKISANAFQDCAEFHSIVIPNSVIDIEQGAFRNCLYLETVTMPDAFADRVVDLFGKKFVREGDIWKCVKEECNFGGFCF